MRWVPLFLLFFPAIADEYDQVLRQTRVKYQQESCWSFCNLVTEMPWDTALGFGPQTKYIYVQGEGAILALVDKTSEDSVLAVGVSWGVCKSDNKSFRVHYYQKNSRGRWYEIERKRPGM